MIWPHRKRRRLPDVSQDPFLAIKTADALPDFITAACAGLFDKIRIGQLGPAQSDKITNAFFEEFFGKFWVFDSIRRDDRDVERFFICLCHMLFPARTVRIGFTIGIGIAGTAITDIDGIDTARFQIAGNFQPVFQCEEPFYGRHFIATHAHHNGKAAQFLPDTLDDFADKPTAVFPAQSAQHWEPDWDGPSAPDWT